MLFMVVERFKNGDPAPVRERFEKHGRMLPEGVTYVTSWIDSPRARCFQVMEAANRGKLDEWIANWSDIVDFDVIPVIASQEYWKMIRDARSNRASTGS